MPEYGNRTSISWPPPVKENLDYLVDLMATNQNEIAREAVNLYASLARLAAAGVPIYVKDSEGREIPYAVPRMHDAYTQNMIAAAAPTPEME